MENNESDINENIFSEKEETNEKREMLRRQYEITHNSYAEPKETPVKKSGSVSKTALIVTVVLCLLFSAAGGILAGNITAKKALENAGGSDNVIMYESVIREVAKKEDEDPVLTTEQAVALTENSIVEIRTEVMTTGTFMTQYISEGAGSGVVVSENGYIATNNHVIDGASKITVTLKNGTSYDAQLVATDEESDIAVIKIAAENLQPVIFADSGSLTIGQSVIIIGNPLGELGGSVTGGIISATDREINVEGQLMTLLQTDAAVNPGNSGGGLFNLYGELVGIVNAKSAGEEIDGIGFAIPSNNAKTAITDLIEYGYIRNRVRLGITMVDVSGQRNMLYYGVSKPGVYIYSVNENVSNSLATEMGLKRGDRIVSINGTEIETASQVSTLVKSLSVGESIKIVIERNEKQFTFEATASEYIPSAE